jgi:hypothetical protein
MACLNFKNGPKIGLRPLGVKIMVSIICIIVYTKILRMLWQYIASLHVIPRPCSSKYVATYNAHYRPMTSSK